MVAVGERAVSWKNAHLSLLVFPLLRIPSPAAKRFGETDDAAARSALPSVDALRRQRERQAEEARQHERTVSPLRSLAEDLGSVPSLLAPVLLSRTETLLSVRWAPNR